MTLLWNVPRDWETNEPITAEKLNDISDQINYLYSPSRKLVTVRGTGVNPTTTATSAGHIDQAIYQVYLELTGARDVTVKLRGVAANNTLATAMRFDILIDNTTYLSTLTASPLATGVAQMSEHVANNSMYVNIEVTIPAGTLSAGFHTFSPVWWVSAGTGTWFETGFSQFEVTEQ